MHHHPRVLLRPCPLHPSASHDLTGVAASLPAPSPFSRFLSFLGFTALLYPLNSFQMGLPLFLLPSRRCHASGARWLPIGRCRAERSICRGFGSAGCGGSFCAGLAGQRSAGTWRRSQTPSGLGRPDARGAVPRSGSPDGRMVPATLSTAKVPLRRWGRGLEMGLGNKGRFLLGA